MCACVCAKLLQSCPTLCDSMDCRLPVFPIRGILLARILECVAMPSSRRSFQPRVQPASLLSPTLAGSFFTISASWEALPAHQFSRSVMSDSLWPHGLQHPRLPCPSPTPKACSNSCPLSQWCHLISSSSAVPFSSCLQSFPASGSFRMSQFFT